MTRMRPYYSRPGWQDRFRVREALTVAAETVVLVSGVFGLGLLIWLLAPAAPK